MSLKKTIQECSKNNLSAQKELYEFFAPKLYGICLKYSRNKAEAEDNLQDTFIKVFDKIGQFKHKGSFEGWIKRICVNTCLARYRKQQVFELVNEDQIEDDYVEVEEENLSLQFLLSCIQELPNRYRLVFNLYVLDGYSHKEVADILGITEGTSKSNLARARGILQEKINENTDLENHKAGER
ncbi:MAG: RNA polymerase sigma factor [Bacteroidota bacterium]